MLDKERHGIILKSILTDIFQDAELSTQLIFKGGTCLMMFYGLDRFSTDLDFDIREGNFEVSLEKISAIVEKYIQVDLKESRAKRFNYTWVGSYAPTFQKVKIEINHRERLADFDIKSFFGVNVPTMTPEKMLANKLAAITQRSTLQNRDLYDADFMFKKQWSPDRTTLEKRAGKTVEQYYLELAKMLNSPSVRKNVLDGLGMVLDEKQKKWAKNPLVDSLRAQLLMRAESTD